MKRYYLWTIGCQMNDADAATIHTELQARGMLPVAEPDDADLVVLITCVVRQSAEDKVVGRLASLKSLKRGRSAVGLGDTPPAGLRRASTAPAGPRIAVMGCFVGDIAELRQRFPHVDAFFGPSDIAGLMRFVEKQGLTAGRPLIRRQVPVCAYVPISLGCDHHCTYCIVRLRRGPQQSRPLGQVLEEVRRLAEQGVREVTFLGQNVDAYGKDLGAGAPDLADLMRAACGVDDIWRVRFLTSHPGDMSAKVIATVAAEPKICPHFELPVQSGNDEILRRMGRGYTVAQFRDLVAAIRAQIPSCSIATDVIVGFPGETENQFQGTYELLAGLRFDSVHIAKYSPRPGTPAARLPDDVPADEKERRRSLLEELQTRISGEINQALIGQKVNVLVEDRHRGRWRGRTVSNKLVFFEDDHDWRGQLATVRIFWAGPWSLRGEVVTADRDAVG